MNNNLSLKKLSLLVSNSRSLKVYTSLIDIAKSVTNALLLSVILDEIFKIKQNGVSLGGMYLRNQTKLTKDKIHNARKRLKDLGLIDYSQSDHACLFYTINENLLYTLLKSREEENISYESAEDEY
jgi:hypothetical protein